MNTSDSRPCYWPDGNPAAGVVPCTDDENTHCCGTTSICLTNGYCLDTNQPFVVSRGGCTSSNWGSGCPTECRKKRHLERRRIDHQSLLHRRSLIILLRHPDRRRSFNRLSQRLAFPDGLGGIDSRARRPLGVTNSSSTATSNLTALPTGTGSSSPQASSTSGNHDAAIGAGVGVPLGVIALGSIIWAFWERRRANKASRALTRAPWSDEREMARRWGGRSTAPTELDSGGYPSELMSSERSATHS
ncbi:hypothetical protein N7470_003204 [Penicillium chermesinum]|nr:hypothetical protein N7470_003204 [Penicillium chermesinum]